nr:hypothetical protein [Tanacetum cinerariifolium]GEX68588.1 hypothetical protein [Tanacetum cinerariifolium]GEX68592.1 hypothetical protein [Tanacetum cinerariifolium]
MFKQMTLTNIKSNEITFFGVLSACSHTELVKKGTYYFDVMRYEYLIKTTSEHYTCIIDLFSRFGVVNKAAGISKKMIADGIEVPASVWGSMLEACRLHKEYKLGKMVGEKMLELEPSNSGEYIILTEMNLHSENRDKAADILVRMRDKGIKKQPGCSWIEVKIAEPADDDHKRILYKQKQESARKDVERGFGVLKKKWAILVNPTRALKKEMIINMMYTCIILHNMIRKYIIYAISLKWFPKEAHQLDDPLRNEEQVQQVMRWIRSAQAHQNLQHDLIEHLSRNA